MHDLGLHRGGKTPVAGTMFLSYLWLQAKEAAAMGSFYTGIHLCLRSGVALPNGFLPSAIGKAICSQGYEVAGEGCQPERSLRWISADGWLSVYDELCESQDTELLDATAKALSSAFRAVGVSVLGHDSDLVELRLYQSGVMIDLFNSAPGLFADSLSAAGFTPEGQADRWRDVIATGVTVDAVAAAFKSKETFADRIAEEIGKCLGLGHERFCVGYNYLTAGEVPMSTESLSFCAPVILPAEEGGNAIAPNVQPFFAPSAPLVAVGMSGRIDLSTINVGGPGKGVVAVVWGDAIEKGLITLERGNIWLLSDAPVEGTGPIPPRMVGGDDQRRFVFEFEDLPLRVGSPRYVEQSLPPAQQASATRRWQAAQVNFKVSFHAVAAGRASIWFGVATVGASEMYALEGEVEVTASTPTYLEQQEHMMRAQERISGYRK